MPFDLWQSGEWAATISIAGSMTNALHQHAHSLPKRPWTPANTGTLKIQALHRFLVEDGPLRRCMLFLLATIFLYVGAGWGIVPAFARVLWTGKVFFVKLLFGAIAVWLITNKMGARLCYRLDHLPDTYN